MHLSHREGKRLFSTGIFSISEGIENLERYAQWIAEASGADCFELSDVRKKNMDDYDAIIYGSWACV